MDEIDQTTVDRYVLCLQILSSNTETIISEHEYHSFREMLDNFLIVLDIEETFDVLTQNYCELESGMFEVAISDIVFSYQGTVEFNQRRREIARRFSNFLSSARLYLDTLPSLAVRSLGDGTKTRQITAAPSARYDAELSYRTMEALRNYAQHRSLPVHGLSTIRAWDDRTTPSQLSHTIHPNINLEDLESSTFKPSVLRELKKNRKEDAFGRLKNSIELKPLLREYMGALGEFHQLFRSASETNVAAWISKIKSTLTDFKATHDEEPVALCAVPMGAGGTFAGKPINIGLHIVDQYEYLQKKTGNFVNFARRRADY